MNRVDVLRSGDAVVDHDNTFFVKKWTGEWLSPWHIE